MEPFRQIIVTFNPEGGTKVLWSMSSRFRDPLPHKYQLQVAMSSASTADDFVADEYIDVGIESDNTFFAVDDEKRTVGKQLRDVHYRVKLTTPKGIYYSALASNRSYLNRREFLHVRDMIRQVKKMIRKYTGCYEGFLFKQKRYGTGCRRCLDPLTNEVSQSKCPVCLGTGFEAGYYAGIPNFYMQLGLEDSLEKVDTQVAGTVRPLTIEGRCAADVLVNTQDFFLANRSGARWKVERVRTLAEYRGHPIEFSLALQLLPGSHVAYQVPIGGI